MSPLDRVGPINHPLLCGNSYSDGKLNLATARSVHCGQSYSRAVRIPAWDGWMDMGENLRRVFFAFVQLKAPFAFNGRDQAKMLRTAFNRRQNP